MNPKLSELFDVLVPMSGPAETVEGEMVRAINKILYRYNNDGDYWFDGYGCETAGPAVEFLCSADCPLDLQDDFDSTEFKYESEYEALLFGIADRIVEYIESRDSYQENEFDMLDYSPKYDSQDDYDDYYE